MLCYYITDAMDLLLTLSAAPKVNAGPRRPMQSDPHVVRVHLWDAGPLPDAPDPARQSRRLRPARRDAHRIRPELAVGQYPQHAAYPALTGHAPDQRIRRTTNVRTHGPPELFWNEHYGPRRG